ncbi:hypothetical protein AeRB84_018884 [Aphanomyces euteiches]|nr:hypothetical protein AeRB84_018884 [Aphanomyces euteiches]
MRRCEFEPKTLHGVWTTSLSTHLHVVCTIERWRMRHIEETATTTIQKEECSVSTRITLRTLRILPRQHGQPNQHAAYSKDAWAWVQGLVILTIGVRVGFTIVVALSIALTTSKSTAHLPDVFPTSKCHPIVPARACLRLRRLLVHPRRVPNAADAPLELWLAKRLVGDQLGPGLAELSWRTLLRVSVDALWVKKLAHGDQEVRDFAAKTLLDRHDDGLLGVPETIEE